MLTLLDGADPPPQIWAHGAAAAAEASPAAEEAHLPAILASHGGSPTQAAIAAAQASLRADLHIFSLSHHTSTPAQPLQLALTRGRAAALRRLSFASLGQCWVRTSPGCVPRPRIAMFDLDGTCTQVGVWMTGGRG